MMWIYLNYIDRTVDLAANLPRLGVQRITEHDLADDRLQGRRTGCSFPSIKRLSFLTAWKGMTFN